MTALWIEIDASLGAPLWSAFRGHMARGSECICVHEAASDPHGQWGRPSMMTVVGHRGGASLLRLEPTWDAGEDYRRENEVTRYWLPGDRKESEG